MKNSHSIKRISKLMSLALRHKPQVLNLTLDEFGWTDTQTLIDNIQQKIGDFDLATLKNVVENNDKKRFAFNEDTSRIRANQGHSIPIKLGYEPQLPPETLYHGTATRFVDSILKEGLLKRQRHHVHLSADVNTATAVGKRHGKPIILLIQAKQMHEEGFEFFLSDNNVWLTDHVPTQFIELQS